MSTTPTADQANQIIASVGDFGDNFLRNNLNSVWAGYASVGGRLQYLYSRRDLIDMAMGEIRKRVSFSSPQDVGIDESDLLKGLLAMKKQVLDEIARELSGGDVAVAVGGIASALTGEMIVTGSTSLTGNRGQSDANSVEFRGSPYRTNPRRVR